MVVIFMLTLIPLIMNIGSLLVNYPKDIESFYFTYYNQLTFFFPLAVSLVICMVFYGEFKNHMYLNWISCGIPKTKLYLGKFIFSMIINLSLIITNFLLLLLSFKVFEAKLNITNFSILDVFYSYFSYTSMMLIFSLLFGSILILLSRNIIVSVSFIFIFMIVSAIFMAAPFSYYIPFSFPYRLGLSYIDLEYYYENPSQATMIGFTLYFVCILLLCLFVQIIMRHKRAIETN